MAEAFGIACHELVSLDFRSGSNPEVQREPQNVGSWGQSRHRFRAAGGLFIAKPGHSSVVSAAWIFGLPTASLPVKEDYRMAPLAVPSTKQPD
jgi:hypothetical protein